MKNKTWIVFFLITATLVIFSPLAFAGKIYKWVDSDGNTHYGDKAPAGTQATRIIPDTRKVGTAVPTAQENKIAEEAAQARKENKALSAENKRSRKEEKAIRVEQCKTAKEHIAKLEPTPMVLVKGEDGNSRRLSDNERLSWLQKARDVQTANCD